MLQRAFPPPVQQMDGDRTRLAQLALDVFRALRMGYEAAKAVTNLAIAASRNPVVVRVEPDRDVVARVGDQPHTPIGRGKPRRHLVGAVVGRAEREHQLLLTRVLL